MALQEPALLSAALAVAASHHCRWRGTSDNISRKYLGSAAKSLRDRLSKGDLVSSPVTLASMLLFVTYEVPAPLQLLNAILITSTGVLRLISLERPLRWDSRVDGSAERLFNDRSVSQDMDMSHRHAVCDESWPAWDAGNGIMAGCKPRYRHHRCLVWMLIQASKTYGNKSLSIIPVVCA